MFDFSGSQATAAGAGATPEAMVQTLQRIPIATDIVDRINKHCEWIEPNNHANNHIFQ